MQAAHNPDFHQHVLQAAEARGVQLAVFLAFAQAVQLDEVKTDMMLGARCYHTAAAAVEGGTLLDLMGKVEREVVDKTVEVGQSQVK
jgi:hypothetical protein